MIELQGKYSNAKVFTDNIENEAVSQIIELCNQEFVEDSKIRIMPDCLTEDTEVLTEYGFIKITELDYEDKIAAYDENSAQVSFEYPENILVRDKRDNEKVYKYECKAQNVGIRVSENHRMALKLNMGMQANEVEEFAIKDFVLSAEGIKSEIYDELIDDEIRLIAWVVGDGSFQYIQRRITFGVKKERKIRRIKQLLDNLKLSYHEYTTNKQTTFTIRKKSADKIIKYLSEKKEYPKEFIRLSKHQAKVLLDEAIQVDGDFEGFLNRGSYSFNGKSTKNLDILSAVLSLNLGYTVLKQRMVFSNFKDRRVGMNYMRYIPKERIMYSRSGTHKRKFIREEIDYDGKLVCITCSTSYFVARQNGMVFVTGNCHSGAGCVIGTTMTITDKVVPNLVGMDIGCGMETVKLKEKEIDLEKLDGVIRDNVPSGFSVRGNVHNFIDKVNLKNLGCIGDIKNLHRVELSLGTLGGGNHFIEVDKSGDGSLYLIIHSGSRNLGKQVAEYYQNKAVEGLTDNRAEINELINRLKSEGRQHEINDEMKKIKKPTIKKDLAYVLEGDFEDYIHDMEITQEFANQNRKAMVDVILREMLLTEDKSFTTIHNYIDMENMILRKGAISAQKGEKVLIPLNMRDGCILAIGKGNEDWNYSAPHGAGRLYSRSRAKELINLEDFEKEMEGIFTTSVGTSTIDEAPGAYKPMKEIIDNVQDTIGIVEVIKPIYNFKSS